MQPPHNPEPCWLRGNPKFELEVVPVLAGVTAVGVGWDEELPPHSWWHYPQSRGMWLSPHFLPSGQLETPEHCPWSCRGEAELCSLSVPPFQGTAEDPGQRGQPAVAHPGGRKHLQCL